MPTTDPIAPTTVGALRGARSGSHIRFRGIPFAQDTGGPERFQSPRPMAPWREVRDALADGDVAPQDPLVPPPFRAEGPSSEHCLFLNVHTPALDDARRPVLFWVHGGGFSHGAGSQPTYDGGPLCERGDVVVVTINYRVGALGYLYLGGHGGDEWGATPNLGQLDQIAALRWVHDNIASFGGDPDNVTIFGQSAGGVAVHALLAMPATRGLVHKAIAQSGTAARIFDREGAALVAGAYLDRLGLPSPTHAELLAVSVDDLLAAQGSRGAMAPMIDGTSLPTAPLAFVEDGGAGDIPLLLGTARDEQKLYADPKRAELSDGDLADQVRTVLPRRAADRVDEAIDTYRRSRVERDLPASNNDVLDAVGTTSRFRLPAIRLAEAQRAHQPNTFLYQVDWESSGRRGTLGACHGIEVPLVFGTAGAAGSMPMCGVGPEVDHLSDQMMDAWIAFARNGDPSHDGIGPWPAYDTDARSTMIFGRRTGAVDAPFDEERALWESMLQRPTPEPTATATATATVRA